MKNIFANPSTTVAALMWITFSISVWLFSLMVSARGDEIISDNIGVVHTDLVTKKNNEKLPILRKFFWSYYTETERVNYSVDRFGDRSSLISEGTTLTLAVAVICFGFAALAKFLFRNEKVKLTFFLFFVSIPFLITLLKLEFLLWISGLY